MLLVSKSARVVASHRHHSSKRRSHTALDIADSLERLLLRLPSWGADANSVLVRLEKQGYEAEDCDDVEMSVRDQNGKVIRCPYCGSEEDCEHTLAVIDTTWAVCEGGYSYKRFDEFGTAIEEYFLQQLRKGTRNVSGRRDRLIGELWNESVEKYSPGDEEISIERYGLTELIIDLFEASDAKQVTFGSITGYRALRVPTARSTPKSQRLYLKLR